jgi:hypothetical protein
MNKDKVLELAREAELVRQLAIEVPFVVDRLERFAALIEAEVRKKSNRDSVFELMLEAGCSKYCDPKHPELDGFIVNDSVLERIVALIEREIRGAAEPVAWMYGWDGKKHLTFVDQRPIEKSHPHFNKSIPLYTHPAPAVNEASGDCNHQWIRTGAMSTTEKRCIKCGEWGKK